MLSAAKTAVLVGCAALCAAALSGCQTPVHAEADASELAVGGVYRTTRPMLGVRWGDEVFLVETLRPTRDSKPSEVYRIPTGTEIEILKIRSENTITHNIERRAIGIDTSRQHCPSKMSMPARRADNPSLSRAR
jgi:hypothetical protein